jgi:hypothetical protein
MEHNTSAENIAGNNAVTTIQIRRRIFQGDSVLPLLFCVEHIPLTHELSRADCGYQVHGAEGKIS